MTTSLVKPGTPGRYRFIRQQDTEKSKPYTSCRIVALMMQLVYAGLEFTDDRKFLETFRKATGVAEVAANGKTQGTTAADVLHAASLMIPWVPIEFGPWREDVFLDSLRSSMTASVAVSYGALPASMRTYSPNFRGKHQIMLKRSRYHNKREQVLWVDCLGPKGHGGKWVDWSSARKWLKDSGTIPASGRVYATTIDKGAALSTFMRVVGVFGPPAAVRVPKGTETFTEDTSRGRLVKGKPTTSTHTSHTEAVVRVTNYPSTSPSGPFVKLVDGPYKGVYVRQTAVTITPPPAPGDCTPSIDAATQPLKEEIASQDRAIEAAIAALMGTRE